MKNKRKPLVVVLICIAVVLAAAVGIWFFWLKDYLAASSAPPVYVNTVSSIVGLDTGSTPRYSGIVEPQQTYKINKDESKTVAEVLVEPGDEVHAGDVLFRYDTQEMQFSLDQAEIDLEGIASQITTLQRQLTNLQADKKKAGKDEQASYTIQINETEIQIKQQQSNSAKKQTEIEKLRESLNNADVVSEVDGVVKEVNNGSSPNDYSGQPSAFISILSSGEYRIKGSVSELNYASIFVGQAVTVHSRLDPAQVWNGTIDSIDQEAASNQGQNMGYYYGMESGEKSSTYNFYVVLENLEGLILGQHVYIEPDLGISARKEGLWLPAMYIAHDDNGSFLWIKGDDDKLEKQVVTLGEYDSDNDMYEIKTGVSRTDSIAYPNDNLMPGMPTTTDASLEGAFPEDPAGSTDAPLYDDPAIPTGDDAFLPENGGDMDPYYDEGNSYSEDNGMEAGQVFPEDSDGASANEDAFSGGEGETE